MTCFRKIITVFILTAIFVSLVQGHGHKCCKDSKKSCKSKSSENCHDSSKESKEKEETSYPVTYGDEENALLVTNNGDEEKSHAGTNDGVEEKSPTMTTYWDEEKKATVTMIGNIRYLPGLEPSLDPIPEPNDPELPERAEANTVDQSKLEKYCEVAPKISAPCGLKSLCQKNDEKKPSYICGTTSIAALVCKVDQDTTTPGARELCEDYDSKCNTENCKSMHWPKFYPSSRYQIDSFKICNWLAQRGETIRGCDTCKVPETGIPSDSEMTDWNLLNTSCQSFHDYADICNSMPGLEGCEVWRTMCATVPNVSKVFPDWCNAEAMAARNIVYDATLADIKSDPVISPMDEPSGASMHISSVAFALSAILLGFMAL